jgi:hypothetical protein
MVILIDNQGFEKVFSYEEDIDWISIHWIRFMIHARKTFETKKTVKYCGSKA